MPLTVSVVAGQVAETVDVCIGGQGPYPFILDTGAGQSTIDAGLAHRLHLATAGRGRPSSPASGAPAPPGPCRWAPGRSTASPLAPQQLTAATLPQMGGKGEPDGLLGSDVLSRFGGVRIDFDRGALILPGPEGAPLDQSTPYTGPQGSPPAALTAGGERDDGAAHRDAGAGRRVAQRGGPLRRGPRRDFVVDTGSSQSVVSSSVARAQSLAATDLAQRQSTVCSVITVPLVHSGPWSVPGLALHPQLIGSTDFGTISLVRHPGPVGLGPAPALRMGRPRLRRGADGARLTSRSRSDRPFFHGVS